MLRGSLRVYPGLPGTNVHLGRILLFRKDYPKAKTAYLALLAVYSGPLKHAVIIDVLTIAIGFVLVAGQMALAATFAALAATRSARANALKIASMW